MEDTDDNALTVDNGLSGERTGELLFAVARRLADDWSTQEDRLTDICRYALQPGGKLFRPLLLLESASAVDGDFTTVLPAAAGAEAGHVASLIHDDIIDGDEMRRGRPSVPSVFGRDDAIVAGDALIFYLFQGLFACGALGVPAERVLAAAGTVADAGLDLCRGQSMEADLCARFVCDVGAYLEMIRLKTSSMFRAACRSGAILGGGPPIWVDALGRYGDLLGSAFQIHDDLLAYTSDSAAMGKAATSDIANQRLTLPFLLARELGSTAFVDELDRQLRGDGDPVQRLTTMTAMVREIGAVDAAAEAARAHAARAADTLLVLPSSPSRDALTAVAHAAVDRAA